MRIEVRPAIPGEQSAQWRCDSNECGTTWNVTHDMDQVFKDGIDHAKADHGIVDFWFHIEGCAL